MPVGRSCVADIPDELAIHQMPRSTYTIVVEPEPDGGYFVTLPALPGCFTRGSTIEECKERAVEAIETHIAAMEADGEPVSEEAGKATLLAVTVAA